MWVLILTLSFIYNGSPAVSMIHLDGFKTEDGCKTAGKVWEDQQTEKNQKFHYKDFSANTSCVHQL